MGNIEELNRINIELCENFEGCTKSPDGKCYVAEKYKEWIGDEEWKAVDESSSQGEGKEKQNKETSYMVCVEHGGIIYYYLRKDQTGAVSAVKTSKSDSRRRLNQMNLFFNPVDIDGYDFLDHDGSDLDPLRNSLGF